MVLITPLWRAKPWFLIYITGTSGALPSEDSSTDKASLNAMGVGIPDASGGTPAGRLAHLRKSHASQGYSSQAS